MLRVVGFLLAATTSVAAFADEPGGTYRGSYNCIFGQGITGDTSTFLVEKNKTVKLIQAVYSIQGGKLFPTAVFEYQGQYDPSTRAYTFISAAVVGENHYWVPATLPNKYTVSKDGQTLTRNILNPGCTASPYTKVGPLTPTPGAVSSPLRVKPLGQG
jgi:hypothetical protein